MKSFRKLVASDAKEFDEATLISWLLGLFSTVLVIAFAISYLGGF